jgi:hypothetical protein
VSWVRALRGLTTTSDNGRYEIVSFFIFIAFMLLNTDYGFWVPPLATEK